MDINIKNITSAAIFHLSFLFIYERNFERIYMRSHFSPRSSDKFEMIVYSKSKLIIFKTLT